VQLSPIDIVGLFVLESRKTDACKVAGGNFVFASKLHYLSAEVAAPDDA